MLLVAEPLFRPLFSVQYLCNIFRDQQPDVRRMELCAAGGGASVPTSRLPHLLSDLHHQQRQHLLSKDVLHYIDNVSAVRKYIVCPTATISKSVFKAKQNSSEQKHKIF